MEEEAAVERFPGVYAVGDRLATRNLVPGVRVYGERLLAVAGFEYRAWNPRRSKLAAAILCGLKELPLREDSKVLYLGAASGTTASHISDIAVKGRVYCVEFSPRVFPSLLALAELRHNIIPILADARRPHLYAPLLEACDLVYQDVAQPEQAAILLENARYFLKPGGFFMLAVKARSVDIAMAPRDVYSQEAQRLRDGGMEILELLPLEPHEKDHAMVVGRKGG